MGHVIEGKGKVLGLETVLPSSSSSICESFRNQNSIPVYDLTNSDDEDNIESGDCNIEEIRHEDFAGKA